LACAPVAELQKLIDAIHDVSCSSAGERSTFFRANAGGVAKDKDVQVKLEGLGDDGFISV